MRLRTFNRLTSAAAIVLGLVGIALPATAAILQASSSTAGAASIGPTCTDSWTNTAGGSWDVGTNWSTGSAPGFDDVACITAAGSFTVVVGNETLTMAGLVVGGAGSTPTLQIGNGGSGYPTITVNGEVDIAGGTLSSGWAGTYTFDSVQNSGTFEVATSPYGSNYSIGSFTNDGALDVDANADYSLPTNSAELTNASSGTLSVASNVSLAISTPSSNDGAVVDQAGTLDNSGSLTIADELEISGGSICGEAPWVGAGNAGTGGTLSFDSTVVSGSSCGPDVATDQIFIPNVAASVVGTIPASYTVSIGDGGSGYPNVAFSDLTNDGTLSAGWGGTFTGPLTNDGDFEVPSSGFNSSLSTTDITNNATMDIDGNMSVSLATSSTTWANNGALTVASGQSLALGSPNGQTGTFVEDGLITNDGSTTVADAFQAAGGTVCGNAVYIGSGDSGTGGTLSFAAKPTAGTTCATGVATNQLFIPNVTATIETNIPKGWTVGIGDGGSSYAHVTWLGQSNAGTLAPAAGATVTDTNAITNTGTISVPAEGYSTVLDLGGLTSSGKLVADSELTITLPTGSTLAAKTTTVGATGELSTNVSVTSSGKLSLASGSTLSVGGTFTQGSAGTLASQVGSGGAGEIEAEGMSSIAGSSDITSAKGFVPNSSGRYAVLASAGLSGDVSTQKGGYTVTSNGTSLIAHPLFTSSDTANFTVGQYGDFEVTTGSSSVAITTNSKLPSGLSFVPNGTGTADISGTPTCASADSCSNAKTWTITLSGIGGDLKGKQKLALTVDLAPSFSSADSKTVKAGSAVSIAAKAVGYPAPSITASGEPSWLTLTSSKAGTATLSGTAPSDGQGTYDFELEASNSLATVTQEFTLTVK